MRCSSSPCVASPQTRLAVNGRDKPKERLAWDYVVNVVHKCAVRNSFADVIIHIEEVMRGRESAWWMSFLLCETYKLESKRRQSSATGVGPASADIVNAAANDAKQKLTFAGLVRRAIDLASEGVDPWSAIKYIGTVLEDGDDGRWAFLIWEAYRARLESLEAVGGHQAGALSAAEGHAFNQGAKRRRFGRGVIKAKQLRAAKAPPTADDDEEPTSDTMASANMGLLKTAHKLAKHPPAFRNLIHNVRSLAWDGAAPWDVIMYLGVVLGEGTGYPWKMIKLWETYKEERCSITDGVARGIDCP